MLRGGSREKHEGGRGRRVTLKGNRKLSEKKNNNVGGWQLPTMWAGFRESIP